MVGFLALNVMMEAAGWVGALAAERMTMLTVMFSGMVGAGPVGGGLLGGMLSPSAPPRPPNGRGMAGRGEAVSSP
jgi:hypothetical protein